MVGALVTGAFAYPFNPTPRTVVNDGDTITIRTFGDEHYHFTQTDDEILINKGEDGVYYYADENGDATKFKVHKKNKRKSKEEAFLKKLNRKKAFENHRKRHTDRHPRPAADSSTGPASWVPSAKSSELPDDAPMVLRLPDPEAHSHGTNRFPVLMVSSPSQKNKDSLAVYKMLNQEGYNTDGYTGSVRDYFVDQSSGVFSPQFDLYFVSVNKEFSTYMNNESSLIKDAIADLLSKYPDFDAKKYDSNNDGNIDATPVLFAGAAPESNGYSLGGFQYRLEWDRVGRQNANNGKKFNTYFIIEQENYLFPTFLHEFSHTMGLKDHYCVRANNCYNNFGNQGIQAPGVHYWDVMATGMYANSGKTPPSYSGFEREFMNWMEYSTLDEQVTVIPPLNTANVAYKIPVPGNNNEWFVLENRQLTKWDAALPTHGMLIWHIDFNQETWDNDEMNDNVNHQRIDVVEAGTVWAPDYTSGFSAKYFKDDPFPGSTNTTNYGPFKSWSGSELSVSLYSITEKNNNVCFATAEGANVGDCEYVSSSSVAAASSSSIAAASSATIASSNSLWRSSSSIRPASSNSLTQRIVTLEFQDTIGIGENYERTKFSLNPDTTVKILGIPLESIKDSVQFYGVFSDGTLESKTTALGNGHWFDKNGNICEWSEDESVKLFAEVDLATMTVEIGHYPGHVADKDGYTIRQALVYNGIQITYVMHVKISAALGVDRAVAKVDNAAARVNIADGVLNVLLQSRGNNAVQVFDMQGNLLKSVRFGGAEARVDLREMGSGARLVRVNEGGRVVMNRLVNVK